MATREIFEIEIDVCEQNLLKAFEQASVVIGQASMPTLIAQMKSFYTPVTLQVPNLTFQTHARLESKQTKLENKNG